MDLAKKATGVTTRHNTRQHDTIRVKHDKTRDNTSTTRHNMRQYDTTRDNTNTTGNNTSKTRYNRSAKQPKIYFYLFVSSLHARSLVY